MNIMNLYVYENRSISNDLSKPLMLENLNVDNVQIHIPKEIDGTDMGTWAWWLVYQNAKREKYSIPMTLEGVTNDEGEEEYISTVGLNHGFTGKHGTVMYAIEAIQADGSGAVTHEWHTKTYKLEIVYTLQGNQTEYDESESDIISALISRVNELIQSGAEIAEIAETIENAAETAQEVIGSIPADYTALSTQVSQLSADLDDLDDRVEALESGSSGSGLTDAVKTALMNIVNHIAWDDDDPTGQTYITALQNALYPPADLVSISAVYTQSGTVYDTDTLDSLKSDLVVTALMSDQTTRTITDYTLSGTLTEGTSTITVSYGGKTTTFTVTVSVYSTAPVIAVQNAYISTDYTTHSYNGFGVTKKYEYLFSENTIQNCKYYDSTNDYMTTNGWAGVKYYTADVNTVASGVSWPSGGKAKNSLFKDSEGAGYGSITKNSESNWQFSRNSTRAMRSNGLALTLPLLDLDDCYAYWYKPSAASILPDGVTEGDIIFAGANTQYYGKHNIND